MAETRKTVLFIVEGSSDKAALEKIFKTIYRADKNIDFRFTDGDISSDQTFLKSDVVNGTPDSLRESWDYIKEKLHSVERHTNLHVYFMMHPYWAG